MIPESPRYLVAQGKEKDAHRVFSKIIEEIHIKPMIDAIKKTVMQERKPQLSDLIGRSGGILLIVWVGMGLSVLQQFVGINVIFYLTFRTSDK